MGARTSSSTKPGFRTYTQWQARFLLLSVKLSRRAQIFGRRWSLFSRLYIGSRREIASRARFRSPRYNRPGGLRYFGCGSAACPAVTLMAIFDAADV